MEGSVDVGHYCSEFGGGRGDGVVPDPVVAAVTGGEGAVLAGDDVSINQSVVRNKTRNENGRGELTVGYTHSYKYNNSVSDRKLSWSPRKPHSQVPSPEKRHNQHTPSSNPETASPATKNWPH